MSEAATTDVDGRELRLTNLDKVLYPDADFTKARVIDYYARVAKVMVPHLRRRPLTMVRWPDGTSTEPFFEKRCPKHRPAWMDVGGNEDNCLIDETAGLVWTANLAALELHVPQWRVDEPGVPTAVVFDLDPGAPADIADCCSVALQIRALLDQIGLPVLAKTSGSKGLHLSVPIAPDTTDEHTRRFAFALGSHLAEQNDQVIVEMDKAKRRSRVFVDWSQNAAAKTTVCVYSLRGRARPTVSTPLTWEEVEAGAGGAVLAFEAPDVLDRIADHGDLWAAAHEPAPSLPRL